MMYHELKKVTWPSRKELVNYTLVVIAFMVATGIIIGLIDAGASALIQLITH
ncbi:MAG TPA: preprotein translocase subunit SecE [Candidatus Ornithocaccomicrobium faecavium]|uniref:Protein translocase subunit SecE n=1 Tax=Candidatus Ornithocaccomicrobium faecavium TaxID=2840890 RepID=A0A9D1TET8_9FIRM|nr:preprotein translocase subunit SecE [Candidatus Ornithocaccomicrobium faecavium]